MMSNERKAPLPLWHGRRRALGVMVLLPFLLAAVLSLIPVITRSTSPAGVSPGGDQPHAEAIPMPTESPAGRFSPGTPRSDSVKTPAPPRADGSAPPLVAAEDPFEGNLALTLSGNATRPLEPGASASLDIRVTNPSSHAVTLSFLAVEIRSISAPNATLSLPCSVADYAVQQVAQGFTVTVPSAASATLGSLGLPESAWPHLVMLSTEFDQIGCFGATVALRYSASGRAS